MQRVICQIEHITKEFPGVVALSDVSLDIHEGEIHAIVGENGAGKSTLMNILSGVYRPTGGRVRFDGREVHFNAPADAARIGIAMIHQELSLSATLSVAENIFQGRLPKNKLGLIDTRRLLCASRELMNEVGLKDVDPQAVVRNINASQQQQVEIAKALSQDARFLILDEPTSALTPNETKVLFEIMLCLKRKGFTMLYISHKLDEVMAISDRVTVFRDGRLIDTLVTREIGVNDMISLMVGREYSGGYQRSRYMTREDYKKAGVILEVKDLSIKNKVRDVSFRLYEGEVLGLAGLVGAGRTEILQAVFGADPRLSGAILIDGKELSMKSTREAIRHGLGLVPEGRKTQGLFLKFSVQQNMSIVRLNSALGCLGLIRRRAEEREAEEYRQRLRVKTPSLSQRVVNLSGGNQQKAIIARWLMNKPRILFLDEPTQGIDVGAKNEIYDIIDTLAGSGVSVVMVSSEMQETIRLCDRIIVLYEGRVTGEIAHDEATEQRIISGMAGQTA
ncbi:MAG: sugar ABC transporter ATP-binding protein [Clostridiales bacterium]|nr:sugar ABC transporter ATP-binding protein [Clostridiales bacterium]